MQASPSWSLQMLGRVRLARHGVESQAPRIGTKACALLAWLACRAGYAGPRAVLLDLLWGDRPIEQARTAMRQCLFQLRAALGPSGPIGSTRDSVCLMEGAVDVDLSRFLRLASSTRKEDRLAACALYSGDFAEDLSVTSAFDGWLNHERLKFRHAAARLVELAASEACGTWEGGIVEQLAQTLLARDSQHEGCWRALMIVHARCGLQAKSEAAWHECRRTLRTQAGVEPSAQTRRVHETLASEQPRPRFVLSSRAVAPPLKPDDAAAAAHDHFVRGWQHYYNGSAADNALAREAFASAAALEPGRSDYGTFAAWTYFTDFSFAWNGPASVNYARAAAQARQLRSLFPRDAWPHALEAKLALWRGEWARALEQFGLAKAALPQFAHLWANEADALLRVGRPEEALHALERAMELDPRERGAFLLMAGLAHFALGEMEDAQASFEAALRRNSSFCVAYGGIAAVQGELGLVEGARDAASRSRIWKLEPGLRQALHTLGPYSDPHVTWRWRKAWARAGLGVR